MKKPLKDRFWEKVDRKESREECWPWLGARISNGYGVVGVNGISTGAHRVAYELERGKIPNGLHIDHLCRVRHCVNPWHMEPVTHRENNNRGIGVTAVNAKKSECKRGHALRGKNLHIIKSKQGRLRSCRICELLRSHWHRRGKAFDLDAVARKIRAPEEVQAIIDKL